MPNERPPTNAEKIERRAIERELTAQLTSDKKTEQKNEHKARRLRATLARVNRTDRDK